jgi:lipopolysaccharide cholinephosphotransferase
MTEDFSKYNSEGTTLRKAQLRMLDILVEFDKICCKHNIPYCLDGGTLLGAVRHGGFIPWDDDLDVKILQRDYKRLLIALEEELPPQYKLQTGKTDKNYLFDFAKIRDINSCIEDQNTIHGLKYNGIYLDIFMIEPAFSLAIKQKLDRIRFRYVFRKASKNALGRFFNTAICVLYPLYYARIYITRFLSRFIKVKIYLHSPGIFFYHVHKLDEIFPLKKISFEGKLFSCPNNVDAFLTRLYGADFMQIPPLEKRAIHASEIIFYD